MAFERGSKTYLVPKDAKEKEMRHDIQILSEEKIFRQADVQRITTKIPYFSEATS